MRQSNDFVFPERATNAGLLAKSVMEISQYVCLASNPSESARTLRILGNEVYSLATSELSR